MTESVDLLPTPRSLFYLCFPSFSYHQRDDANLTFIYNMIDALNSSTFILGSLNVNNSGSGLSNYIKGKTIPVANRGGP
jgi:hypothetical protein